MTRTFALSAAGIAAAALACFALIAREQPQRHQTLPPAAILQQTVLVVGGGEPLSLPALTAADGTLFEPAHLEGHWSVIFFGFTSCPHVCPTTLQVLGAAARDPASGVPAGTTQIVFVSVDP
ncbi:MAG: SCO family protein, partial [Steroidobacteraceae bacterium]